MNDIVWGVCRCTAWCMSLRTFGVQFLVCPTLVSCVLGEDKGGWDRGWCSALVPSGQCLLEFEGGGEGCVVVGGSSHKNVFVLELLVG